MNLASVFQHKNDVEVITIDNIWKEIEPDYQKARIDFKAQWGTKFQIMIILYCIFIIPGFIYHLFVWNPGKAQREQMALTFLQETLSKIFNNSKSIPISDAVATISPYMEYVEHSLMSASAFFGGKGGKASKPRSGFFSRGTNTSRQSTSSEVDSLIFYTGLVSELAIDETAGLLSIGAQTISLTMNVFNSGKITLKIDNVPINMYNLKIVIQRVEMRQIRTKNGTQTVYETITRTPFSGLVCISETQLPYVAELLIKTKSFGKSSNSQIGNIQWKNLEYPLAEQEFNESFILKVGSEDGVSLRKTFQPRHMAYLVDFSSKSTPFAMISIPNHGVSLAMRSINSGGTPMYISNVNSFFSNSEKAKSIIEKNIQPIFETIQLVYQLQKNGFLTPNNTNSTQTIQTTNL